MDSEIAHDADLDQCFGHSIVDQHAVGAKDDDKAQSDRMAGNVENIRTDKRLSAGNHQQAPFIHFGYLINEAEAFFRAEFIRPAAGLRRGVQITMIALEIASLGEVQGNKIGLEVIDGPAIIRRCGRRGRGDELRDLLLK